MRCTPHHLQHFIPSQELRRKPLRCHHLCSILIYTPICRAKQVVRTLSEAKDWAGLFRAVSSARTLLAHHPEVFGGGGEGDRELVRIAVSLAAAASSSRRSAVQTNGLRCSAELFRCGFVVRRVGLRCCRAFGLVYLEVSWRTPRCVREPAVLLSPHATATRTLPPSPPLPPPARNETGVRGSGRR